MSPSRCFLRDALWLGEPLHVTWACGMTRLLAAAARVRKWIKSSARAEAYVARFLQPLRVDHQPLLTSADYKLAEEHKLDDAEHYQICTSVSTSLYGLFGEAII